MNKTTTILPLLLLLSSALMQPAIAAGKAYGHDHLAICRKLASVPGVYEVWCEPNAPLGELEYQVVVRKSISQGEMAKTLSALHIASKSAHATSEFPHVDINIWTYKSLASMDRVERAMASAYPFPDCRDEEVDAFSTAK